jgi:hypothetical protein
VFNIQLKANLEVLQGNAAHLALVAGRMVRPDAVVPRTIFDTPSFPRPLGWHSMTKARSRSATPALT